MESRTVEDDERRLTDSIIGHLLALGYRAEAPAILRGISGADHTASLSATANGGARILLDTYFSTEKVGEAEVVSTFMKVLDTYPSEAYIVCIPGANNLARRLARFYAVKMVEGGSVEEAVNNLGALLPSAASLQQAEAPRASELDFDASGAVKCYKCGYTWRTRSGSRYVTCPSCHFKINQERLRGAVRPPEQGKRMALDSPAAP